MTQQNKDRDKEIIYDTAEELSHLNKELIELAEQKQHYLKKIDTAIEKKQDQIEYKKSQLQSLIVDRDEYKTASGGYRANFEGYGVFKANKPSLSIKPIEEMYPQYFNTVTKTEFSKSKFNEDYSQKDIVIEDNKLIHVPTGEIIHADWEVKQNFHFKGEQ